MSFIFRFTIVFRLVENNAFWPPDPLSSTVFFFRVSYDTQKLLSCVHVAGLGLAFINVFTLELKSSLQCHEMSSTLPLRQIKSVAKSASSSAFYPSTESAFVWLLYKPFIFRSLIGVDFLNNKQIKSQRHVFYPSTKSALGWFFF